jgi:hypothetical protein
MAGASFRGSHSHLKGGFAVAKKKAKKKGGAKKAAKRKK